MIKIVGKCKHQVPSGYFSFREVERNVGLCDCGHKVELLEFTNTCEKCGADYNMSGQCLAPRSQWGWDTGESLGDILSIGHSIN